MCNLSRTKPLSGKHRLPVMKIQTVTITSIATGSVGQTCAYPETGEQNPWISQTLRFTHIHNEKQPTDVVPGLSPIDNAEL